MVVDYDYHLNTGAVASEFGNPVFDNIPVEPTERVLQTSPVSPERHDIFIRFFDLHQCLLGRKCFLPLTM